MKNNLLLLSPSCSVATGNHTTLRRISTNLITCLPSKINDILERSIFDFKSNLELEIFLQENSIKCIIALHAVHCSKFLEDVQVPFILIFGGTDLNECSKCKNKLKIMQKIVNKAAFTVSFGISMKEKFESLWPCVMKDNHLIIAQGISTNPSTFNLNLWFKENYKLNPKNIFLLVASIRHVKDPLFLVEKFSDWHLAGHSESYLVIIGPKVDEEYFKKVKNVIDRSEGVFLMSHLNSSDLHAAIQQSFVMINSSKSEGMASSILEAMDLGTPCVVRDIPGNRDLVSHSDTGLLFDSPEKFIEMIELLIKDTALRENITCRAKLKVLNSHSCEDEANSYKCLIEKIF